MRLTLFLDSALRRLPLILLGLILICAALLPLLSAYQGFPMYRDIHLGAAITYAEEGIDLLRPKIVGFTATDTPTPQELPLWQALTAIFLKFGGGWWGWANVTSLLMFCTALWPAYRLGNWVGQECGTDALLCGRWSVTWLISIPIVFCLAGQGSVDGWAMATSLWFFYFAIHLLKSGRWCWFWPACIFGILAATTKLPFFFACGIAAGIYHLVSHPRSTLRWAQISLVGLISGALFLIWTKWCDSQLALAEFPHFELRLSHNPAMWDHYFGTWDYKLNPANWLKGGWRMLSTLFGSFALGGFFIGTFFIIRSKLLWSWLVGCVVLLAVFTHLVLIHRHYYIIFAPLVAWSFGCIITKIQTQFLTTSARKFFFLIAVPLTLFLATAQGLILMEIPLRFDPYPAQIAQRVDSLLPAQAKAVIQNGGWGGDIFMRMQRPGLTITTNKLLQSEGQFRRLKDLGYTHLIMLAESPLLHAFQVTNPGEAGLKRLSKYHITTPLLDRWTPMHEDSDIVIFDFEKYPKQAPYPRQTLGTE